MGGRLPVEYFPRALVEHILIGAELLIRNQRQVGAFWEVVADAIVLTLTGGPLPRAMGMAEEDLQLEVCGERGVFGHLLALVVGEAFTQGAWQGRELAFKGLPYAGGVFLGKVTEDGEPGGAFD